MSDQIVASVMAFRGEEEYLNATDVLLQPTDLKGDRVEVAFTLPVRNGPRIYMTFSIADLIRTALPVGKD